MRYITGNKMNSRQSCARRGYLYKLYKNLTKNASSHFRKKKVEMDILQEDGIRPRENKTSLQRLIPLTACHNKNDSLDEMIFHELF